MTISTKGWRSKVSFTLESWQITWWEASNVDVLTVFLCTDLRLMLRCRPRVGFGVLGRGMGSLSAPRRWPRLSWITCRMLRTHSCFSSSDDACGEREDDGPQTLKMLSNSCMIIKMSSDGSQQELSPLGCTHLQDRLVVWCRRSSNPQSKLTGIPLYVLRYTKLWGLREGRVVRVRQQQVNLIKSFGNRWLVCLIDLILRTFHQFTYQFMWTFCL